MTLFSSVELVHAQGDRFLVKLHDKDKVEKLKDLVPGVRKNDSKSFWIAHGNTDNVRGLRELGMPFTLAAKKLAHDLPKRERELIELSKATTLDLDLHGFGKQPYPFQQAGIAYTLNRKRVLIGDEMGLGKTIQALGAVHYADAYPVLILTPASNKYHWAENEIPACLPGKRVCLAGKDTGYFELALADIIVTNYEQLVGFRTLPGGKRTSFADPDKKQVILSALATHLTTIPFKAIVCDEAHYLKTPGTARTLAAMALKNCEYRILLTGTPMLNRPAELWSLLRFLDRHNEFGGFWHFHNFYCGPTKGRNGPEYKGATNTLSLNEKMRASCYIRRRKKDVLTELPDKIRTPYAVDISNREEYEFAEKELIEWVKQRVLKDQEFLNSISHLSEPERKEAITERQMDKAMRAERGQTMVMITALKTLVAEGKLKAAKEWIDNFIDTGEKLVIFATHRKILDQLLKWYPHSARIIGDDDVQDRQANVQRFQSTDVQLLIGAMGTSAVSSPAGIGHTLTAASNVLFLELGWTPGHHNQCEDRCHRIGQKDSVNVHYLLGRDTIDQALANIIELKRRLAVQVEDGLEELTEAGIVEELSEWLANKAA